MSGLDEGVAAPRESRLEGKWPLKDAHSREGNRPDQEIPLLVCRLPVHET
jgi:hypothetical protein